MDELLQCRQLTLFDKQLLVELRRRPEDHNLLVEERRRAEGLCDRHTARVGNRPELLGGFDRLLDAGGDLRRHLPGGLEQVRLRLLVLGRPVHPQLTDVQSHQHGGKPVDVIGVGMRRDNEVDDVGRVVPLDMCDDRFAGLGKAAVDDHDRLRGAHAEEVAEAQRDRLTALALGARLDEVDLDAHSKATALERD